MQYIVSILVLYFYTVL